MFKFFLPKEEKFFDQFEKHAALLVKCAKVFCSLADEKNSIATAAKEIKHLEHQADIITHHTVEILHKTFITPFDRDLIFKLISCLDDVIDNMEEAADDLVVYKIEKMRPEALAMVQILLKSTLEIEKGVIGLRNLKNTDQIRACCKAINTFENEADVVLRNAIGVLFEEEDKTRDLIKWKDIYENLEAAVDKCEDVANILEGIILEFS
jgi:predicted phosphate transport protein (TIGR00153 family)